MYLESGSRSAVAIWIGGRSLKNFASSAQTLTWGFKNEPSGLDGNVKYVVFGTNFWNGVDRGPRSAQNAWETIAVADFSVCEIATPIYEATSPLWPDELAEGKCIYPFRFGFVERLSLKQHGVFDVLGDDGIAAMKKFLGGGDRLGQFGLDIQGLPQDNVDSGGKSFSLLESYSDGIPRKRASKKKSNSNARQPFAGRSTDPAFRKAVETRAEAVAEAHLRSLGWSSIKRLGKPFDLVCTRMDEDGNVAEKHVEVKGASGGASAVEYTPNEVNHFRNCPFGADLVVVRDISVSGESPNFEATGGTLLHVENYKAPDEHLEPIKWQGTVPWQ